MKHISFRFNWFNDEKDNFQIQVIQRLDFVIHWFIRNGEKSLIHKEKEYVKKKDPLGESSDWKMKKQNTHFTSPGQVTKSPLKRYWFRGEGSSLMKHVIVYMSFCCKNDEKCHFALVFVLTLCKNLPSWKCVFSSRLWKLCDFALPGLLDFRMRAAWVVKKNDAWLPTNRTQSPSGPAHLQQVQKVPELTVQITHYMPQSSSFRRVKKHVRIVVFEGFFFNQEVLLSSVPYVF